MACRSQCTLDNPVGDATQATGALDACLAAHCANECALRCGAFVAEIAAPPVADACQSCIYTTGNLCDQARACAASADCESYLHCRRACMTGDCVGECGNGVSADQTLFGPFFRGVQSSCAGACQAGDNWSCVGRVHFPTAQSAMRVLTVSFTDVLTSQPKAGLLVKMCEPGAATCPDPVSQAMTDDAGAAVLTDTTTAINSPGYGADDFLDVSGSGLYPTDVYLGFPLVESRGRIGEPIPIFSTIEFGGATLGYSIDPGTGALAALAVDCLFIEAPDVTMSLISQDGGTASPIYTQNNMLSPAAKATDAAGLGLFLNVPPGSVTVTATPVGHDGPSSTVPAHVLAGKLTLVGLQPTP
jgi:hypothetical protein